MSDDYGFILGEPNASTGRYTSEPPIYPCIGGVRRIVKYHPSGEHEEVLLFFHRVVVVGRAYGVWTAETEPPIEARFVMRALIDMNPALAEECQLS